MTTTAKAGQFLLVASANGADRGDLVAVCDTEEEIGEARRRSGYASGVLSERIAGRGRTPRGCEIDYSDDVTDEQLIQLLGEAIDAGDKDMAGMCRRVLNPLWLGDYRERRILEKKINGR